MKFVKRADNAPGINLAPLIDIVFLLLIFIMASSRFVETNRLRLELPAAANARTAAPARPIVVAVAADGRYRLAGRAVAADALSASLQDRHAQHPHRALRVRADARARHAAVVRVLDAAAGAGFVRVDIATRSSR